MDFRLVTTETGWQSLKEAWDALLPESISPYPFLDCAYLQTWWQTRGGGEWPQESQLAIIVGEEAGTLVGIAPLFFAPGQEAALRFLGQIEVSDYLDVIVRQDHLSNFLEGLLAFIASADLPTKSLDLANIISDSPTLTALPAACEAAGWDCECSVIQPSIYLQMAATWDDYLAGIDKKQRHEIRRKMRNAESNYEVGFTIMGPEHDCQKEMDSFMTMMRHEPDKDAFLTEPMVTFIGDSARIFCSQGRLHLCFLTFNQVKVAAYYSILAGKDLLVYNSAYAAEYFQASPGWVLLGKVIQWAIENGFEKVDLMRGDEVYKYRFGGIERFVHRFSCQPR